MPYNSTETSIQNIPFGASGTSVTANAPHLKLLENTNFLKAITDAWLDQDVRTTASPVFAGLNLSDGNITNVGSISLDSIISDGSTITIGGTPSIVLTDNTTIAITLGNDAGDDFTIDSAFVVAGDTGKVGIRTANPETGLDLSDGTATGAFLIGADTNSLTRTNEAGKRGQIVGYHYTNAEEFVGLLMSNSTTTGNLIAIGGGSGGVNAATLVNFYTGATTTTLSGTLRMSIDSSGNVGINTTGPDRKLDILDASNPQLRLTNTDGVDFVDHQVDSDGNYTITPSGDRVAINGLATKVIDIGDWDMLAATGTSFVDVAHGLTLADIRSVSVSIRRDSANTVLSLASNITVSNGYWLAGVSNIQLNRITGGFFDDDNYDSTSFNRGWITITYVA